MRAIRKILSAVGWFAFALALFAFLAMLLSGCNRQAQCTAYEAGRVAACAACNLLPTECPFEKSSGNEATTEGSE